MTASTPPEHVCRLRDMMRRLDVDVLEFRYDAFGATVEQARQTCERCSNVDDCIDWLTFTQGQAEPDFCPNLEAFERFRRG
jgi:hypothetical protein